METTSAAVVRVEPYFSEGEEQALAGFLSGYRGLKREAYASDLRQFVNWCSERHIAVFAARRVDIECFARDLEARGKARATVAPRLCTIAGLYRYAEEERLIDHSPAVHVRRPRVDYESHATGLDRNELGALLVAARLSSARDHQAGRAAHLAARLHPRRPRRRRAPARRPRGRIPRRPPDHHALRPRPRLTRPPPRLHRRHLRRRSRPLKQRRSHAAPEAGTV